jgi:hypothetical protein
LVAATPRPGCDTGLVFDHKLGASTLELAPGLPCSLRARVAAPLDEVMALASNTFVLKQLIDDKLIGLKGVSINQSAIATKVGDIEFFVDMIVLEIGESITSIT